MKKLCWLGVVLLSAGMFWGCQSSKKMVVGDVQPSASWSAKMQVLAARLNNLTPYIFSKEEFESQSNRSYIENEVNEFFLQLKRVETHSYSKMPDHDPSLRMTATQLTSDVSLALESLKNNHFEYSRSLLKSAMGHCYYCHTRNNMGPEFKLNNKGIDLAGFPVSERVDYLVATRQFQKAMDYLENTVKEDGGKFAKTFEVERALRRYLVLAVRVKKDPKLASAILETYLKKTKEPSYLKSNVTKWKSSLSSWRKEKQSKKNKIKQAEDLIRKAKVIQDYPYDSSADILFLRASSLLHDSLKDDLSPQIYAKASYLLGHCYEVIRDTGFWNLNEVYYEACIRRSPHSNMSKKCFERYEKSLLLGYSGSAGINIPMTARMKLRELKELAFANMTKMPQ